MIAELGYRGVLRPLLFRAYGGDAERVHDQTLATISRLGASRPGRGALAALCARHRRPVTVAGIQFPGLVGLAARYGQGRSRPRGLGRPGLRLC